MIACHSRNVSWAWSPASWKYSASWRAATHPARRAAGGVLGLRERRLRATPGEQVCGQARAPWPEQAVLGGELPLAQQLSELELNGVLIDADRLAELGRECNAEIKRLEQEAQRIAGREFNLNSPRQLETLLFDELGLKPIQAHQNLALHRRRHARGAQRQARATARNSGATPGQQAQGHLHRRAARTAQPQDRARPQLGSKPWPPPAVALVHRPQPPEHSDPNRAGAQDPRRFRGGARP